jgi:elongation factor G
MKMEIVVPEENMGDAMENISSRRGRVLEVKATAASKLIHAMVPMAEVLKYAPTRLP